MCDSSDTGGNPNGVIVRGMIRSDVPAMLSILCESPETSMWSENSLRESCGSESAWVAERGKCVVGFLIGRAAADEFEILNLAVAKAYRRNGIGSRLLESALNWFRTAETQRAYLEVRASNEAAIALYERHGFSACGRRARYYQHPVEDAIVLSKGGGSV
jgi:[ribosomal protein S18]-alanine N-acetyltransferase